MSNPKKLEKLGRLVAIASDNSRTFFDKCSKTKILAVNDYYRAEDEYIRLATQTLDAKGLGIGDRGDCTMYLSCVKSALETGQLNQDLIDALENLRATYVESLLRPAFKRYFNNDSDKKALEQFYTNAVKIESLIEVFQFLNKVQNLD